MFWLRVSLIPILAGPAAIAGTGCDRVFGLDGRTDPAFESDAPAAGDAPSGIDAPRSCMTEDFGADYAAIASRWDRYSGGSTASATVDVKGGALHFSLPIAATLNYAGIIRNVPVDLTTGSVQLEIIDAAGFPESFELFIKLYDTVETGRYYQALLGGEKLHFLQVSGVTADPSPFAFDPVTHRYWRVRHDPDRGQMVFETSADNNTFTERLTHVTANVPVDKLRMEIGSGTFGVQTSMLEPRVDNFLFCP